MTLDDLEQLANAATRDEWAKVEQAGGDVRVSFGIYGTTGIIMRENAAFIAACDPQTVLKLVKLARAAAEVRRTDHHLDDDPDPSKSEHANARTREHSSPWSPPSTPWSRHDPKRKLSDLVPALHSLQEGTRLSRLS